jgi:putative FmdB family regulatory protein
MPLYEYACQQCSNRFDQLRSIAEADAVAACPACGSQQTTRSLSAIAAPNIGKDAPEVGYSATGCACGGACACGAH